MAENTPSSARVDRAVAPTAEEAKAANAGEYTPRGANRFLYNISRNWAVRLGLVGAAGVVAYQSVPQIQEFVDARYHDALQALGLEINIPPTFNNAALEGVIGAQNTEALSLSKIQEQFPRQVIEQGNTLTFLFPFQVPEGAKAKYARRFTGMLVNPEATTEAIQNQVKDQVIFTLPEGATIIAPATGNVLIYEPLQDPGDNPTLSFGALVFYYDKALDTTYLIRFGPGDMGRNVFEPLQPILKPLTWDWGDTNWQKLPIIQRGQPLLKLPRDRDVRITIRAYRGEIVGPRGDVIDKTLFVLTPNFLTTTEDRQEKMIVLEN